MGVSLFCRGEPFSFSDIHSSISADYSLSPTDRLTIYLINNQIKRVTRPTDKDEIIDLHELRIEVIMLD
jgi:hypothetical protein